MYFFAIQVREYEEYLNRRHAVCNSKEEDLAILQNVSELLSCGGAAFIVFV